MTKNEAPNLRPLYECCASCKHSDALGDYCEKYQFSVCDGADRICDDWEDYQ
jgi:hypothetical protein